MAKQSPVHPRQPYECSNPECENVVRPRRLSESGDHWCPQPACQAMKQRTIRAARKRLEMQGVTQEDERMMLVHAALHRPRRSCPECDLEDGVDGFLHRSAPGSALPCSGLGAAGRSAGPHWIDLIHPDRRTARTEDDS